MELEHLTIDTGHTRISPRNEVADEVVTAIAAAINSVPLKEDLHIFADAAFEGEVAGFTFKGIRTDNTYGYSIATNGTSAVHCSLETKEHKAKLSIKSLSGIIGVTPTILSQLGDLERCIAWTLIEHPVSSQKH